MTKVLLAEDEPALREVFCEAIRSLGLECIPAANGVEAITLAGIHRPELIVTDYMMPGGSGIDVIQAVQANPALERVPIILMSAGRPPERERNQAWRFLGKPIELDVFEQTLREAIALPADDDAQGHASARVNAAPPVSLPREEMLRWVSHEIKSPLTAAMAANQMAVRGVRSGEASDSVERKLTLIMRQLHRIDELVNSLLDAAQLEDGGLELEMKPVVLAELVRHAVDFWRETQPEVAFELRDSSQHVTVNGDPERLRQVVDNFISNAIKYGRTAGDHRPILLTVRTDGDYDVLSVADHGPGIPATELPRLFERFHRVSGHGQRGHGLGLYIAAAVARLHGGSVQAQSEVGHGSTFSLSLPRRAEQRAAISPAGPTPP